MDKLKIAAYVQLNRLKNPTGVGKHILNMVEALQTMGRVDLRVFAANDNRPRADTAPEAFRLAGLGWGITELPYSRKLLEMSWLLAGRPSADRWVGDADWIYSPTEVAIPTRRCRLAVTSHHLEWIETDLPWSHTMRWERKKWLYRLNRLCRKADLLLAVSEYLRQRLVETMAVDPARIAVVGNGVEQEYFDVGGLPRAQGQQPYLLAIGGLTERKGAAIILGAARILADRKAGIQIWVAGTSEHRYRKLAGSFQNIKHLGYPSLQALPRILRDATALVFPSRYEMFGIPAVEAMAAGTPPIVSHWAALPEVVADGGVILEEDSAEALVEVAMRLASDDGYRAALAAKGRARAAAFTWDACASRLVRAMLALPT